MPGGLRAEAVGTDRNATIGGQVSDEQIDDSGAMPTSEGAKEQFRQELDALRLKYEELGLDFDAAIREHQARKSDDG
jgi:hypothetical protein